VSSSAAIVVGLLTALTVCSTADAQYEPGGYWNAPDRGEKAMRIRPGAQTPDLTPETLLADWTAAQVQRWMQEHPDWDAPSAAVQYAQTAPTDAELQADFPRHVAPFARVRSGEVDAQTRQNAMFSYCPFCGSRTMSLTFDGNNPYGHATTTCCGTHLYADEADYPGDYALPVTETVRFLHLDDSWYEAPCAVYEDADGVVWELFIPTIFDHKRWIEQGCALVKRYGAEFEKTADPLYAHKIAVILDRAADTYYELPLCYLNELADGKDGEPVTRAEWESVPRPAIFEVSYLGPWNRRTPIGNRGWLNMLDEHIWVEPFALVRHHPAFRHYSQQTYGDPAALDLKVRRKLLRELSLMFQSVFAQKLLHNYQEANYTDMWLLGMLIPDRTLIDFAGPCQELSMYNHSYQDGMNGEGAPNYMHMPGGYYFPFLADPDGWLRYQPNFLEENPFYEAASSEMFRTRTARGLYLEFGDQHQYAFDGRLVTDPAQVRERERIGSRNWPGYGVGLLRVGGPGHRQEVSLDYTRATLHNARDALSMQCWVDGVPVLRKGGYSAHWHNVPIDWDRPEYQALREMDYPREIQSCEAGFSSWSWVWSHSAQCQNAAMVNETPTGAGWGDNRGYGECVTFKGGEQAGTPGSGFQVLDVRDHYSFARVEQPVTRFRRTMIGVEGPDGRPYVLDLLRLAGGERHALYTTARAERAGENLPAVADRAADLGEVFLGEAYDDDDEQHRNFRLITSVERLAEPERTWDLTWAADYAAYAPRDPQGREFRRPLDEGVGDVRLRLLGLTDPDGETELIRGKAPWVTWIRQLVPGGHHVNGNLAFKDARDMLVESRQAAADGDLDSLFAHVLEGYRAGEQSAIESMEPLEVTREDEGEAPVVALELTMAGGHTDTVLYQAQPGEVRLPDGTETDARYALVRRDADGQVTHVDACRGTSLRAGEFEAAMPGDFTGTIVDVIGDLTGTRRESALIIRPDAPWPGGENLRDKQLLVRVESDLRDPCNEGYRIASVSAMPGGLVRVDVQDHATFAESWHEVKVLPEDRPNVIRTDRPMVGHGDTPWYNGMSLWFPKHGKTFEIANVNEVGGGYGGDAVTLRGEVDVAAEGIEVGDWYVIHAIRPGLQVTVPNDLCWREEPAQAWRQYALHATGDVTVMAPATGESSFYRLGDGAWEEAPDGRTSFSGAEMGAEWAAIIVGKPDWLDLDDDEAPVLERIVVDGEALTAEEAADLGWIDTPRRAQLTFRDAANPIDIKSLSVMLDGAAVGADDVTLREEDDGRALSVAIDLAAHVDDAQPQRHRLLVTVSDSSIARHEASATLTWIARVALDEDATWLSDLKPVRSFAHGGLILDRDYGGETSEMGDRMYPKSVMICPEPGLGGTFGEVVYELPEAQRPATLVADVGLENMTAGRGSVVFKVQVADSVEGPWETLHESPVMRGGQPPERIEVPLGDAPFLRLYTTDAGDGINSDHALWGNARLK